MQGCHRGINRHSCLPEEDEAGGGARGGRDGAMPSQVRPDPQSQRKDTGGFRSPGGGDDVGRGGVNRRPQLLPDHGIELSKFVVQLGLADAQRHWLVPHQAPTAVWRHPFVRLKTVFKRWDS